MYGTWTVRKVDQTYLDSFQIWCWRWTKKNIWADRVKHETITDSQVGEKHPAYSKKEGRLTGSVTSCVGTAVYYLRKGGRKDRRNGKKKKMR